MIARVLFDLLGFILVLSGRDGELRRALRFMRALCYAGLTRAGYSNIGA